MDTILIVEDEIKISNVLKVYLAEAGYQPHEISNGLEVVDWVKTNQPSLILLDLNLPKKNGIDICKEVRLFSTVPIIMVTAKVEEIDRLIGLEFGADDYVCKPFSPREVVARVNANIRRLNFSNQEIDSGLTIDESKQSAILDGVLLNLTPVEFRILAALNNHKDHLWSRNKLLYKMYDDHREVGDRTVDSHVTNLRKKLKKVRPNSECIKSVYASGYKLKL